MRKRRPAEQNWRVVYPRRRRDHGFEVAGRFPLSLLTVPGAVLYEKAMKNLRTSRLRKRGRGWDGVTVLSIGNIEVGGNGKTPLAMLLTEHLVACGHRPVYVSRGFKSEAERVTAVTVRIPRGARYGPATGSGVRFVRDGHPGLSRVIGDEGAMVAMRCPDTPLVFSRDRGLAVDVALDIFQPTHVVVDDGFQTWQVHRDIDVVLLDANHPVGNGRLVPAGGLREPPSALNRADVVGINGHSDASGLDRFAQLVSRHAGRPIPVFGLRRRLRLIEPTSGRALETLDGRVASLSSIARPRALDEALAARGLDLRLSLRYPDHYRYRAADLRHIERVFSEVEWVVTTEKDWAKLREARPPLRRLLVARLEIAIDGMHIDDLMKKPRTGSAAFSEGRGLEDPCIDPSQGGVESSCSPTSLPDRRSSH
jgi:tetraacyldisaccharide 4'-kinase